MGEKLNIPVSTFHRVENPKHPGEYLYPGVFFLGTKKDPTYYIRYRDKDGKARFEKAGPTATTAALAADIRRDRKSGREEPNAVRKAERQTRKQKSISFQEYSDEWLTRKKSPLAASTHRNYASLLKVHVNPHIGGIPLVDVTYRLIDDLLSRMDGMSGTRKNTVITLIGAIFKDAVKRGDAVTNPTERVDRFREDKADIDPMSWPEVKQCLAYLPDHYRAYFTTAFFTGARPGELMALKKTSIDFELKCISIREGLVRGEIGKLKTVSSRRDIDILPPLLPILKAHLDALPNDPKRLVFTTPSGTAMELTNLREWVWYPALEKAGLRRRTMYQTRHTFASLMLSNGEDMHWVARQLGHANLKQIIEHYSKYIRNRDGADGRKFVQSFYEATAEPKAIENRGLTA
jgi:integrase